jgi:preprotein translocase subunit YajC
MLNQRDFWLSAKETAVGAANPLVMMLLIFGAMYFIMIRPQVKKQKAHQAMLTALQKGDTVITRGGFIGKVSGISDTVITLELQEKVRVRVLRAYVDGKYDESAAVGVVPAKPTVGSAA